MNKPVPALNDDYAAPINQQTDWLLARTRQGIARDRVASPGRMNKVATAWSQTKTQTLINQASRSGKQADQS